MHCKGRGFDTCDAVIVERFMGSSLEHIKPHTGRKSPCSLEDKIDESVGSKYKGRTYEEKADHVDEYRRGKTWFGIQYINSTQNI